MIIRNLTQVPSEILCFFLLLLLGKEGENRSYGIREEDQLKQATTKKKYCFGKTLPSFSREYAKNARNCLEFIFLTVVWSVYLIICCLFSGVNMVARYKKLDTQYCLQTKW